MENSVSMPSNIPACLLFQHRKRRKQDILTQIYLHAANFILESIYPSNYPSIKAKLMLNAIKKANKDGKPQTNTGFIQTNVEISGFSMGEVVSRSKKTRRNLGLLKSHKSWLYLRNKKIVTEDCRIS